MSNKYFDQRITYYIKYLIEKLPAYYSAQRKNMIKNRLYSSF